MAMMPLALMPMLPPRLITLLIFAFYCMNGSYIAFFVVTTPLDVDDVMMLSMQHEWIFWVTSIKVFRKV